MYDLGAARIPHPQIIQKDLIHKSNSWDVSIRITNHM